MKVGLRPILCSAVALLQISIVCLFLEPASGQTSIPTLTVRADEQTKIYGAADPVFTFQYAGFTNGDTASVLSGQPVLAAPQRVQNLWQFTESPTSPAYNLWEFQSDGTYQQLNGIQLSHVVSGGNFYSSISSSIHGSPLPIIYPGMQYLVSFYAVSLIDSNQLNWHRYLGAPGGALGWGPTAVGLNPRRIVFTCVGTKSGELDCGNDPTIALGSDIGVGSFYWLFQGANNVFGGVPSDPNFQRSIPADIYIGGLQIEPTLTEKRGVLAMGDSLTQYDCTNVDSVNCTSWTAFAASQMNIPIYNRGMGGQTCGQVLARWPTDASPILAPNAGYVIIECGTNDIGVPLSASQIEQSISSMYALAKNDGATPVVATIGPFATTVAFDPAEATRQSVNAWIRSTLPLVLDLDKVNADPINPRNQNPAYFSDGTHLNLAGRIAEGNYVAQSISGNLQGYPSVWNFRSPIPYQPVLGPNPSNGMDFSPDARREVGTYIILPSAGTLSSGNYKFSFNSALLSVTPAPLAVAANSKTMTFGDPVPALDGTMSGALAADSISATYSTTATSSSAPGTYSIVPTLVDPKSRLSNYSIKQQPGTLTVLTAPAISNLSPPYAATSAPAFTLFINGSGFVADDVVRWAGNNLITQYVSSTRLSAQVLASDLAKAGMAPIAVLNSISGMGASNTFNFEIDSNTASSNAPVFATPTATVPAGSPATYPVTIPSAAAKVSVSCLNLPAGATCSYSSAAKAVTINTASSTPAGTYQVVVVFAETLSIGGTGLAFLPVLLVPLCKGRKHRRIQTRLACFVLVVMIAGAVSSCGAAAPPGSSVSNWPQTLQVTSSGVVTLIVQ